MTIPQIKVFPTPDAVAEEAAARFIYLANEAIALTEFFSVAFSGGSTPQAMFRLLASDAYRDRVDWLKVKVFFVDERCVPPDHSESNYRLAHSELLSKVPIPLDNVYRMRGEDPDPNAAAKDYGLMLKETFGDGGPDLIFLGMGEDGHTASLFPGTPAIGEQKHRCVAQFVENSTTGPSWRITLTAPFINRARNVLILTTGASKADRVSDVLESPRDPERLPIQLIMPEAGQLSWLIDAAAAGMDRDE